MVAKSSLLVDGRALLDADHLIEAKLAERRASFELFFARLPVHTGFVVIAGIDTVLERLMWPLLESSQLEVVRRVGGFSHHLVRRLEGWAPSVDIDAVPDGTLAFAHTPVVTVEGPFLETVLIGTLVRATVQKATAIATRAARLHIAGGGDAIIDGSSVHATSPNGSVAVARATFIGGTSATTNVIAAAELGIPFRGSARMDLDAFLPPREDGGDTWGASPSDSLRDLGLGDDEEALLLESKRLEVRAGGWIARGLADVDARAFPMRYDLVALEHDGAWSPRRGASDHAADIVPGRKMVVRYSAASGRAVCDTVHLNNERMQSPQELGAATLAPLARAAMRGGHRLLAPEPPTASRDRALLARRTLPPEVLRLRSPAAYAVTLSPALAALAASRV